MTDLSQYIGNFNANDYVGNYEFNTSEHPRSAAIDVLLSYGMKPPQALPTGRIVRFPDAQDKANGKAGWAIYHENIVDDQAIGTLVFGSFRDAPPKTIWSNKKPQYMSAPQKAWHTAKIEQARRQQEEEAQRLNKEAKQNAEDIWKKAKKTEPKRHEYVQRKKIKPYGAGRHNDFVLLPIYVDGQLSSLQYIEADGSKRFLPGGAIKGGYMIIEGKAGRVYICEGWATGCSIHEATGAAVYVAYQRSNLFEVTRHAQKEYPNAVIKIAADDDRFKDTNAGLTDAINVSQSLGVSVVSPVFESKTEGTDFNDLHMQEGLEAVKNQLEPKVEPIQKHEKPQSNIRQLQKPYPGFLDDVVSYYNVTSGNDQPGFALQSALALGSIMCARYFITNQNNTTSLYFLNIGKSGTGKEHSKTIIEEVLHAADMEYRIGGDGFTSDASVIGLLQHSPCSIVCIDEWGRYLGTSGQAGMAHMKSALTTIMEVIARPTGRLRAKNYSQYGLTQEQQEQLRQRYVVHPALTLSASTTPITFYQNVNETSIRDGFLGRFIMYESDAELDIRKPISMIGVPQSILDWVKKIKARIADQIKTEAHNQKPEQILVPFASNAQSVIDDFAYKILDERKKLQESGLDEILNRTVEFSMRMSLICALGRNPEAQTITANDAIWACEYMDASSSYMVKSIKKNMVGSVYDLSKKEVFDAIEKYGDKGILWKDMVMRLPFSKHKQKDLKEILSSLVVGEMITESDEPTGGRPTKRYVVARSQGFGAQIQ